MQVALIILSLGLLGLIIKFAVSPKSSRPLRLAALIALVLIVLAIGICGIILVRGPGENPDEGDFLVFENVPQPPEKKSNLPAILSFLFVFIVILGIIFVIARREQIKNSRPAPDSGGPALSRKSFSWERSGGSRPPPPEKNAGSEKSRKDDMLNNSGGAEL